MTEQPVKTLFGLPIVVTDAAPPETVYLVPSLTPKPIESSGEYRERVARASVRIGPSS